MYYPTFLDESFSRCSMSSMGIESWHQRLGHLEMGMHIRNGKTGYTCMHIPTLFKMINVARCPMSSMALGCGTNEWYISREASASLRGLGTLAKLSVPLHMHVRIQHSIFKSNGFSTEHNHRASFLGSKERQEIRGMF